MSLERHPNPRVYWLLLRWMAWISYACLVGLGVYGVTHEFGLDSSRYRVLMEVLETLGWIVVLWVSLSQGAEAVGKFLDRGK